MSDLLSHLKVVELASVLAGPSVGMFFAEHGAEVIKIENKKYGGDVTRSWKLPSEQESSKISAYFCSVNWGKQHLFLDLSLAEERAECLAHIKEADILITNFKSGDDLKFGVAFEDIKKINPSIIYGAISGFGSDSERIAYDLILQAETGMMSMNGTEDSGPVKMPIAYIDLFAAHHLQEGILLMLQRKEQKAVKVEVSLYDAALSSLVNQATNWLMAKQIPKRIGSKHPNIAPYGELFPTADNETVTFAIGSNKQFKSLCLELGLDHLPEKEEYISNVARVKNRTLMFDEMKAAVAQRESSNLIKRLTALRVPAAVIKDLSQVFEDENAQRLVNMEEVDGIQTKRVRSSIFKIQS